MKTARSLIQTWLVLDFFGDARRRGGNSSTLTTTIFTQAFLALVFAALLYPETPPVPFAAANLSLSTLLIAVSMLGDHDRIDRRRADRELIGSSPAKRRSVVAARAGHAAFYVCLLTTGMALPPAILLGFLQQSALVALGYVALACGCSGLATAALAVTMRLLARLFGAARAALLGGSIKALLLGGGIALFALGLQQLRGTADDLPFGRVGAELLPPYQAARLLADPVGEWWRAAALVLAGAVLALLGLAIGEDERSTGSARRPAGPLRWLLLRLAGRGPSAGLAEFTATTMWRSAGFRARVLPLLGLPAGMIYLSLRDGGGEDTREAGFVFLCVLLQLPAIYLPFLIAFLPRADQDNTSWVFDQAPPLPLEVVRDAAWRALVTHVLVPVHAIAALLLVATSPAPVAVAGASLFSFAVAVAVSRPMCGSLAGIPFTDDRGGEPAVDLGGLFPFALLLLALAIGYGAFATPPVRALALLASIAFAVGLIARRPDVAAAEAPDEARPESPEPVQVTSDEEDRADEGVAETSLRRELRAIGLLYVAVSVLPALVGAAFGP